MRTTAVCVVLVFASLAGGQAARGAAFFHAGDVWRNNAEAKLLEKFPGRLPSIVEENFESLELGQPITSGTRFRPFFITDRSIPVAFEPGSVHNTEKSVLLRRFIEARSDQLMLGTGVPQATDPVLEIVFDHPIFAFGISIFDWGDDAPDGELTFWTDTGELFTIASGAFPDDNAMFFGIVADEPFMSVAYSTSKPAEEFFVDFALTAVPAPGAVAVFGLVAFGLARRRR